jgi:hypothetical protein
MDFKLTVSSQIQIIFLTIQFSLLGVVLSEHFIGISVCMVIEMLSHFLINVFQGYCKVKLIQYFLVCFITLQYRKLFNEYIMLFWLWNLVTMINLLQNGNTKANVIAILLNSFQLYLCGFQWVTLSFFSNACIAQLYHILVSRMETSYEKLLELALDSVADCTLQLDRNYRIVFASKSFIGYSQQELFQKSLWDIIMDSKQESKHRIEKVFTTKNIQKWKWEIGEKTFHARASAVKSDFVLLSLKESIASVKKLEANVKSKNLFFSSISHELRNPLQSITFSLQLLSFTTLTTVSKAKELFIFD